MNSNLPLPIAIQIQIIELVKKSLESEFEITRKTSGICYHLKNIANEYVKTPIACREIPLYIPLFTPSNANVHDNVRGIGYYDYWWDLADITRRIAFLDWILSQLNKELNGNSDNNTTTACDTTKSIGNS